MSLLMTLLTKPLILLHLLGRQPGGLLNPSAQVVQMLQAMSSKGKQELQEEKVQYARLAMGCWCSFSLWDD